MSIFRRRGHHTDDAAADDLQTDDLQTDDLQAEVSPQEPEADADVDAAEPAEQDGEPHGPWDVADVPEIGERLNLGSIWLPTIPGMELRMELERETNRAVAANALVRGSTLRVQAFAAPRTLGIWDEIRGELAVSAEQKGGSADDIPGPFGRELLARLPSRTNTGRTGHRPVRFIGVDGPRWFLRGVISGPAAVEQSAAAQLEGIFADIVVVRGEDARPPRDLLPLNLPGHEEHRSAEPDAVGLDPLTRGPEITEVR